MHTTGPWTLKLNKQYPDAGAEVWTHIETPSGRGGHKRIAALCGENGQADGALIAAAPTMLAVLKECAKQLRLLGDDAHANMAQRTIEMATHE